MNKSAGAPAAISLANVELAAYDAVTRLPVLRRNPSATSLSASFRLAAAKTMMSFDCARASRCTAATAVNAAIPVNNDRRCIRKNHNQDFRPPQVLRAPEPCLLNFLPISRLPERSLGQFAPIIRPGRLVGLRVRPLSNMHRAGIYPFSSINNRPANMNTSRVVDSNAFHDESATGCG